MRLRFLPWVWERLVFPPYSSEAALVKRLKKTVKVSQGDRFLATSVKYFYSLLCLWAGTNSHPLKVHEDIFRVDQAYLPSVRQMLRVLPESPHTTYGVHGRIRYDPTREGAQGGQTPPD